MCLRLTLLITWWYRASRSKKDWYNGTSAQEKTTLIAAFIPHTDFVVFNDFNDVECKIFLFFCLGSAYFTETETFY